MIFIIFSKLGLPTWAQWNVLLVVHNLPSNWLKPKKDKKKKKCNLCRREEPWKRQDGGTSTACAPPAKPPTFLLFTIWIKVFINEFCLPHVGDLMRVWFGSDLDKGLGVLSITAGAGLCLEMIYFSLDTSLMRKETWVTIATWDYQRWIYLFNFELRYYYINY